MFTLGVGLSHHTSIALLHDNEVVLFVLEERMNRKKNFRGIPTKALSLVPSITKKIDRLTLSQGAEQDLKKIVVLLNLLGVSVSKHRIENSNHHLYHAAAGFYMSRLDTASCLVIDGAGSIRKFRENDDIRASETTSVFEVSYPNTFRCTYKNYTVGIYDSNFKFDPNLNVSIKVADEDCDKFKAKIHNVDKVDVSTNTDIGFKYTVVSHKIGFSGVGEEGKTMGLSAYGLINNDPHTKLAFDIQKELEQVFVARAGMCASDNIVLSGGCALNILGNSLIKKTFPNKNIYIDPVAADGTIALGAAAHTFYTNTQCADKLVFNPYGGPNYNLNKQHINELARKYSV